MIIPTPITISQTEGINSFIVIINTVLYDILPEYYVGKGIISFFSLNLDTLLFKKDLFMY